MGEVRKYERRQMAVCFWREASINLCLFARMEKMNLQGRCVVRKNMLEYVGSSTRNNRQTSGNDSVRVGSCAL